MPKTEEEKATAKAAKKAAPKAAKKVVRSERGKPRRGDGVMDVNIPKSGKGNTDADQAWLEEQIEAGLIEEIGDDEEGIPFGAMRRWTGKKDDSDSYWQIQDVENRCTARAKIRDRDGRYVIDENNDPILRPCRRPRIRGGRVCVTHGGGITRVRQAAQLRLAGAADVLIGQLIKIALDPNVDPKARVNAINSALDRAGVKTAIDINVEKAGWEDMLSKLFGDWNEDDEPAPAAPGKAKK